MADRLALLARREHTTLARATGRCPDRAGAGGFREEMRAAMGAGQAALPRDARRLAGTSADGPGPGRGPKRPLVRRGDTRLCDFGNPTGHDQGLQRPALIVPHDEMARCGLPAVLPVTRARRGHPAHAEPGGVLPVTSYVQFEQVRTVPTGRMIRPLAGISDRTLAHTEQILRRILLL